MKELDFKGIMSLVARQKWVLAITAGGILFLLTLALFEITPRYTATALIVIDPQGRHLVSVDSGMVNAPDLGAVDSEVEILASPVIARRVIQRLALQTDDEFNKADIFTQIAALMPWASPLPGLPVDPEAEVPPQMERRIIEQLGKRVTIERRGITTIIAIDVSSRSPEKAALMANAYAAVYIDEQIKSREKFSESAEKVLAAGVANIGEQLRLAESKLDNYALDQASRLSSDSARAQLAKLRADIAQQSDDRDKIQSRSRDLESLIAAGDVEKLVNQLDKTESEPLINERKSVLAQIFANRTNTSAAKQLADRKAAIETQLKELGANQLQGLQAQVEKISSNLQEARSSAEKLIASSDLPADISVQLYKLQEEVATNRTLYQNYLSRLNLVGQQRGLILPDSRIVAEALPPLRPSFPPTIPILIAALGVAFGAGLGAAWLRDTYVRGFLTEEELEEATGLQVIANLPSVKAPRSKDGLTFASDKVIYDKASPYADSVRRLHVGLEILMTGDSPEASKRVVLVTSTRAGEGKSSTAVALGRAAALAGRQVIIIDCDIHRPMVHQLLNVDPTVGLIDFLMHEETSIAGSAFITKDSLSELCAVTSSERVDFPLDRLFDAFRFRVLIQACRQSFDLVILDAPPIGIVSDPLKLATFADIVLYVVRYNETTEHEVVRPLKELLRVKPNDVYLALNGSTKSAKYKRGYGYYG